MEQSWSGLCCACWFVILLLSEVDAVAIDNGLATGPEIECDSHSLTLAASTRNPFGGRIYVKGESMNPDCVVNYTQQASNDIELTVPLMACNVKRLRVPGGAFEYTTTIVVSFHHIFETKVDKAYRVHCSPPLMSLRPFDDLNVHACMNLRFSVFAQLNNTFTAPSIEVSMIPTTETLTQTAGAAECQYEVRRGSVDGPPLRYAVIGEPVFHVWKCDIAGMRILIRDCYVDDGGGNKVATIDSRGCALDRYVIQTPTYIGPDYTMVYTEAHVFKYADRPTVLFQCQIQFCDAADSACQDISPPTCNGALAPTVVGPPLSNATGTTESYLGNQTAGFGTTPTRQNQPLLNATSPSPSPIAPLFGNTTNQTTPSNFTSSTPSFAQANQTIFGANATTSTGPFNHTTPASFVSNLTTLGLPLANATNQTATGGGGGASISGYYPPAFTSPPINRLNATALYENATTYNGTLPFPTPGPMNLSGSGNHTNDTVLEAISGNVTRRIRETPPERKVQLDGYLWDVVSNEFTVMDLDQEMKHGGDHADISDLKAEAQKYIDDASELKQKDSDFLLDAKSEEHRADNRCVPGYEIALAVSVVVTLMITSTAAAAVYWNVKHMRKQMFLHP